MQEDFVITAVSRSDGGKGASRRLRRSGMVPGIIYGGGKAPELVATKHNTLLHHLENEAFYSHILTVGLDGKTQSVVLKDMQRHPAKPFILHFDLLRVAGSDVIKMQIPLHFLGEDVAPGVKNEGGKFSHNVADVEISCQAKDLPEYIEVDVSGMSVGDILHLSDLKLPSGVELVALQADDPDHDVAVASIFIPRVEVEEEESDEVSVTEPVVDEDKEED